VLTVPGQAIAAQAGAHLALGGGGLAHFIIRLFIWHEIWRLIRYLWAIRTFGPFLVIALGIILIGLMVWRRGRGPIRRGGLRWGRRRGFGSTGYGTGSGPRDW
jgi:hypothetical protein